MARRTKNRISKGKDRQSSHNKDTGKYVRQRARTEARKAARKAG